MTSKTIMKPTISPDFPWVPYLILSFANFQNKPSVSVGLVLALQPALTYTILAPVSTVFSVSLDSPSFSPPTISHPHRSDCVVVLLLVLGHLPNIAVNLTTRHCFNLQGIQNHESMNFCFLSHKVYGNLWQ